MPVTKISELPELEKGVLPITLYEIIPDATSMLVCHHTQVPAAEPFNCKVNSPLELCHNINNVAPDPFLTVKG